MTPTKKPQQIMKATIKQVETIRDKKLKLFLELLQGIIWNVPNDFSVSIQKYSYELDDASVAIGRVKLFPNNPRYIIGDAVSDIFHIAKTLRFSMSIEAANGSPYISVSIYISK